MPNEMKRSSNQVFARVIVSVTTLIIALTITQIFVERSWQIQIPVGTHDSAFLGTGFYTKEVSIDNVPFRWTNGSAIVNVPWLRTGYLVAIRANIGPGVSYDFELRDRERQVSSIEAQTGFRTYQVIWSSPLTSSWFGGLGARQLTILSQPRSFPPDNRLLGIAVNRIVFREVDGYSVSLEPFILVSLSIISLTGLLWPFRGKQLFIYIVTALSLPILYELLVWHPPTTNYTWLPFWWLPELLTFVLIGLLFIRYSWDARKGVFVVSGTVFLIALALLVTLQLYWMVEGPDYGWHLNHGGSWERVFRAHDFYPFGFPLVLWLGQLAGNQALLFGRILGTVSTLFTIGLTMALAYRLQGRAFAWYAGLLLLGSPIVVAYGVLASTDAPMVAFAIAALLVLCWHPSLTVYHVILAGFFLGCAYLFRYQAMLFLPATMIWLAFQPIVPLSRSFVWFPHDKWWFKPFLFLLAFIVTTAPQWVLDIRDTGYPFFNRQYINIWLFAYERTDPLPEGTSLAQMWFIVNYDPTALFRHSVENIIQFSLKTIHYLLIWPLGLLAFAGITIVITQSYDKRYSLMLIWIGIYIAAVALTANKTRFFLPIIPLLVLFVLVFLFTIHNRFQSMGRYWNRVSFIFLVGLIVWILFHLPLAETELLGYGTVRW